jgi:hypothetical protein
MASRLKIWGGSGLCGLWLGTTIALLGSLSVSGPALASSRAYRQCNEDMIELELALEPEAIAVACGETLRPRNLSSCVVDITLTTDLLDADVLETCRRVRRPAELGECVADIQEVMGDVEDPMVLETCKDSLLPEVLADCAVGLQEFSPLPNQEILTTCLLGDDEFFEYSILD